jgi:MYXO-CTERM domain-containing protein
MFEGLSLSHDGGCTWAFQGGGLSKEYVIDLAVEPASPLRGVSITSTGIDSNVFHVQVFETADGGASWSAAGAPLKTDLLAETIDVAPSNPKRLYVSGTVEVPGASRKGALETSVDRGATWSRALIDLSGDQSIYIGAVDPTDDQRVYLRTRGSASDRLIVTKDGGKTFSVVTSTSGPMLGLAVSPDGKRIAIGGEGGIFQQRGSRAVSCLAWAGAGLYACGNDFESATTLGSTIALSQDEGASFKPVLPKLANIRGPLETCSKGGSYDLQCSPLWPPLAQLFGTANAGGAAGSGGTTSASGGAAGAGGGEQAPPAGSSGGCSFASKSPSWGAFLLIGLAMLGRSRARRRQRP